jgi:hypothetical protein
MARSPKVVLTNLSLANDQLQGHFEGNKTKLSDSAKVSRTTVHKFFQGSGISESSFRKLCFALRLNFKEISLLETDPSSISSSSTASSNILSKTSQINESLFREVQEFCRQKIYSQDSFIRLLSGKEVGVDQLYVDVYLLERQERKHLKRLRDIAKELDLSEDRYALSKRIGNSKPSLDVANENPKLVICGKPGAGKTTLLKRLAIDWCHKKFQPHLIAILVELREIQDESWSLFKSIKDKMGFKDSGEAQKNFQEMLEGGSLLILMDGLDEVPTSKIRQKVNNEIERFSKSYPKNRFILTCRTQIMERIPDGFESMEVAEFDKEKSELFVLNWFKSSGKSEVEAEEIKGQYESAIKTNPDLRELTRTPVLLSLICLVLQDQGEIIPDKAWLYKKGIRLLLETWNREKQIEEWEIGSEIYQCLKIEDKEKLLIRIAGEKFDNYSETELPSFHLFQENEILNYLGHHLQIKSYEEGLSILKAIEAQSGILIERSDEIWSFSHYSFQEYFVVQWLAELGNEELLEKILLPLWQEKITEIVKSQQPADKLLKIVKIAIDKIVADSANIQSFLNWITRKSETEEKDLNDLHVRKFYFLIYINPFSLARARTRSRSNTVEKYLRLDSLLNVADNIHMTLSHKKFYDYSIDLAHGIVLDRARDQAIDRSISSASLHPYLDIDLDISVILGFAAILDEVPEIIVDLERYLNKVIVGNRKATIQLNVLKENLLNEYEGNRKSFLFWWRQNGSEWIRDVRSATIGIRDIGYDFQFSEEEVFRLQDYYELSNFLCDLLNIDGAINDRDRIEIEETFFLPWSSLQMRQPNNYKNP